MGQIYRRPIDAKADNQLLFLYIFKKKDNLYNLEKRKLVFITKHEYLLTYNLDRILLTDSLLYLMHPRE